METLKALPVFLLLLVSRTEEILYELEVHAKHKGYEEWKRNKTTVHAMFRGFVGAVLFHCH